MSAKNVLLTLLGAEEQEEPEKLPTLEGDRCARCQVGGNGKSSQDKE